MSLTADTPIRGDLREFLGADPGLLAGAFDDDATVGDLFPPAFVAAVSDADSIEELLAEGGFDADAFGAIDREELDAVVAEHTEFEDWAGMVRAAGDEYLHGGSY